MGAWGSAPWDNDLAADWFAELVGDTGLAERVEQTLKHRDLEEYAHDGCRSAGRGTGKPPES